MIRCCRFSFIGTAASPSATRFSLSITAKLDFCPGNYIIFMILDIDLSLDPFPLTGEEVETKRNLPQRKSEQIRYRTSRETKNVDRNTYRSIPDREKCGPQTMALNDVTVSFLLLDLKENEQTLMMTKRTSLKVLHQEFPEYNTTGGTTKETSRPIVYDHWLTAGTIAIIFAVGSQCSV